MDVVNQKYVINELDQAIADLPEGRHPIIHSDRGCYYRWPGWIGRMDQAGLTRSLCPRRAVPPITRPVRVSSDDLKMKCSTAARGWVSHSNFLSTPPSQILRH